MKSIRQWSRSTFVVMTVISTMCSVLLHQWAFGQTSWVQKGYKLIEGDILVKNDWQRSSLATWNTPLWTNGIIPFEFDNNVSGDNQNVLLQAMAQWEQVANVHFIPRTNQGNFVHIQSDGGNSYSDGPGMQAGGQILRIHDWWSIGTILHELGHCLGYWHEQSHPKREQYVQIITDNIQARQESQFELHGDAGYYGPYDFESIMHYDTCAFSKDCPAGFTCNCTHPTIRPRPGYEQLGRLMGQRTHLSRLDAITMSFLYPQPEWRFVDASYSSIVHFGTFQIPFARFTPLMANSIWVPTKAVIWIQPGKYSSVGVYSKPMTLQAPLSDVVLGQ